MVTVRQLTGAEVATCLDVLAGLRIEVFQAFPYLYDGDPDYERRYLSTYAQSPGAVVIGAFDDGELVGAATGSPLRDHFEEFATPFAERGLDIGNFFYFGESVLRESYRGQGIGVGFFEEREKEARAQGFSACVFSAVLRPANHPLRPSNYQPLDKFWKKRGYRRIEDMTTGFSWRDIGDDKETLKPMEYWMKRLEAE